MKLGVFALCLLAISGAANAQAIAGWLRVAEVWLKTIRVLPILGRGLRVSTKSALTFALMAHTPLDALV